MLIDWFTVGAQILNFLILVWLLKRFLYHPILNAIDAREQRIAKELADADAEKTEAGQEREAYQRKNAAFDKERAHCSARQPTQRTASASACSMPHARKPSTWAPGSRTACAVKPRPCIRKSFAVRNRRSSALRARH
ncbi:hypothetical protein QNM99_26650 [Pseudomonas sp. PCH446]